MKYHFKVHKEGSGFWAECIELNSCITQGNSLEELHKNMYESLNLYLDEPEDSKIEFPLPNQKLKGKNVVEVPVESAISFAIILRHLRKVHGLTQRQTADKLGMKNMFSYQRLESSKANPTLKTIEKIQNVFPDLDIRDVIETRDRKKEKVMVEGC